MNIKWEIIVNQFIAQIIAAIALFILSLIFLDNKKVVAPWLYKYFNKNFSRYFYKFLLAIMHPYFRLIIVVFLIIIINYQGGNWIYSLILVLVTLSLLIRPERYERFLPVSEFSDSFNDLDSWERKSGNPVKESDFGKPAPDLILKYTGSDPKNSCLINKQINEYNGVIECDFYLEPNAVFNIIFLGNKDNERWYMARFDSRISESDGFLIKDEGMGQQNWRFFQMSGTQTSIKEWHRARVVFNSEKVFMYKDGQLLVEFEKPDKFGNKMGIFNEVADVHVDNFSFTKNLL
ncbi:MAG: hypothetical protein CEN89_530 [Candidatus Berkelbacteria bacterium Licking1014_7]|uniref:3-keto-disaccharide hydrolase domain-containing protein n=1 Tax=Candidatus Berkelbacteria bacterium Licking1014_7 TaxID=2017147 RepID=A0A554LIJ6_9BACT|nr:MAG: hypothetical protein CEN89_530 [Candidatus Berkelbacteria bacterium Licking1014_7]